MLCCCNVDKLFRFQFFQDAADGFISLLLISARWSHVDIVQYGNIIIIQAKYIHYYRDSLSPYSSHRGHDLSDIRTLDDVLKLQYLPVPLDIQSNVSLCTDIFYLIQTSDPFFLFRY